MLQAQNFDSELEDDLAETAVEPRYTSPEKYISAQGGFNLATVTGKDAGAENNLRAGLHLGAFIYLPVDEIWGFQSEIILFSQKGTTNGNNKFRSSYFEIPLLASYTFNDEWRIIAGLQPSFLISANVSDGRGDITSDIRKVDIGLAMGAYYQFHERLSASARIVPGISKVGESGDENTYNLNIQLSIAYKLFTL